MVAASASGRPLGAAGDLRARGAAGLSPGITLLEILLALALVALILSGAALGISAISSSNLRHSAGRVGAVVSSLSHNAVIKGRPMRLAFDLGSQGFRAEVMAEDDDRAPAYLAAGKRQSGEEPAPEEEAEEPEEAEAKAPAVPGLTLGITDMLKPPAYGRPKPRWEPVEGAKLEPLPSGIKFAALYTPQQAEPFTEGVGYIYFWPSGQTEHALIYLSFADAPEDDPDQFFSVLVDPMTGRAKVIPGRYELPSDLRDFDQPEEVEEEDEDL
jgi:general secretion pathway protein H